MKYYSSGISIIGVEGKNQIPKYWRLFKAFNVNSIIIFDSDSVGNNNLAACFGCDEEDLLSGIDKMKKIKTEKQNLFVFETDFETALKKDFNDDEKWSEYERQAREIIKPTRNGQKGQIARFICNKILEDQNYKPLFLKDLVDETQLFGDEAENNFKNQHS